MGHQGLFWIGVKLFNEGEFFEAHELWEEIWRESEEPDRSFYQGLIQIAVALAHLERGNVIGFHRLIDRAEEHLAEFPPAFGGIRLAELRRQVTELAQWVAAVESNPQPQPEEDRCRPNNGMDDNKLSILSLMSGVKITIEEEAPDQT
ncbi:DUF309 domain-containing protein [Thermogutta sp.]|uniref:DUF309 domain-containing protein n=1 Tax=Thermogutta sp. TaxID=1962930 RepID=UPI003C79A5FB